MFTACFVIPSWHYWKDPLKHTPYWELYYATYIKKAGFDTDVVDIRSMKENHKDLDLKKIVNSKPFKYTNSTFLLDQYFLNIYV